MKITNFLYSLLAGFTLLTACSKDDIPDVRPEEFIVSDTLGKRMAITELDMPVTGGKDTLYVYSDLEFKISFQTDEEEDWISIESSEYLSESGTTRLILNIQPLTDTYGMRLGMLSLTNKASYIGQFIKLSQGYTSRFTEEFTWLKYGTVQPFDETREVPIGNWSTAQKQYGWTSTAMEGSGEAYCFGRNGHIKLGTATSGADLISPKIGGLEKDSILLLTFNAVARVSLSGEKDANKLRVTILEGGEFDSGSQAMVVDANYYDHQSSMLENTMWNKSLHALYIRKTGTNPQAPTLQVRFNTGENDTPVAHNRIYIDNVNLYVVHQHSE